MSKLPEPARIVQGFGMEPEYLYTREQVKELLAQADKDASDLMLIVHMKQTAKYEPALRAALSALKSPGDQAMQDRALGKINEALNG